MEINNFKSINYGTKKIDCSDEEWKTRIELAAFYRIVDHFNWTSLVYNHITARIPHTEHFLINGFGLNYSEITATNLIKIDIEGNKLCGSNLPFNDAGYTIHSAIHSFREEFQCVAHTHSKYSVALSSLSEKFLPVTQEGFQFYERVGYHDYNGIALDLSERKSLQEDLGKQNHTLILKNHGLLICGESIPLCFSRLYQFEKAAEIQLITMSTNSQLNMPSEDVIRKTRHQFEYGDSQAGALTELPEWPATVRLIDKIDASWRE